MLIDLGLGTVVISATVLIHTIGLIALARLIGAVNRWFSLHRHGLGRTMSMIATVLGLFVVHGFEIWLWAFVYVGVGAFDAVDSALYFSTTTFATVGYGDVVLPADWRILGSLEGVNGFMLIGWSTAYLVAASTRYGPFRIGEHF